MNCGRGEPGPYGISRISIMAMRSQPVLYSYFYALSDWTCTFEFLVNLCHMHASITGMLDFVCLFLIGRHKCRHPMG